MAAPATPLAAAPATPRAGNALVTLVRAHLGPYRRAGAVLVVLQVVQTVALLCLPRLSADIIDNGVLAGDTGYIVRRGAVMIGVTVLQVACLLGAVRYGTYIAAAVGRDLRNAVFDTVQRFSLRELGRFGTATLVTRTTNDVQQVQTLLQAALVVLIGAPVTGLGGVVLALGQDTPSALLLLCVLAVLAASMIAIVRRMRPVQRRLQQLVDTVNRVLREQITGIRVIRAFAREEFEQRRFAVANE
jgi:ATP-binding cassette subfamily B protein